MAISQKNSEALKNPWVLAMIAFLIIFVTANIIFIYLAFRSAPDLVVQDFYEKGKDHESKLDRIKQEKRLGWAAQLIVPSQSRVNQVQPYDVFIQGKNSVNLQLDRVTFYAYRPSDADADFSIDMQKKGLGHYSAEISFNLPGIWDVIVEAKQGEQSFSVTKRLNIDP